MASLRGLRRIDQDEYERRFSPEAQVILAGGPDNPSQIKFRKRKTKKPLLKRKRRKLMPHDWAFILRESGQKYPTAERAARPAGSKKQKRQALAEQFEVTSGLSIYDLMRVQRRYEQDELTFERQKLQKRNNLIRRTKKEIGKTKKRTRDLEKENLLEKRMRFERTQCMRVDDEIYELLFSRTIDSFPVRENPDTLEMLKPIRDGKIDYIRIIPRNDQYSPFLEFAFGGIEREFRQSNSHSEWIYIIRLGEFQEEIERYESAVGRDPIRI